MAKFLKWWVSAWIVVVAALIVANFQVIGTDAKLTTSAIAATLQ